MNRQERRKLEKKGRLERGDLKRISDDISHDATNAAFQMFMLFSVFSLRDEFGFGDKRTDRYLDAVNRKIEEFNAGCFELKEMAEAMQLEIGYTTEKVREVRRAIG